MMFNPGSLSGDGKNLRRDTTLRILRGLCKEAKLNPFVINLFDYATTLPQDLFKNWDLRDGVGLVYPKLAGFKFAGLIAAYGDYENYGIHDEAIRQRASLVMATLGTTAEVMLPRNHSGTPKHPMAWQRQRLIPAVVEALTCSGSGRQIA